MSWHGGVDVSDLELIHLQQRETALTVEQVIDNILLFGFIYKQKNICFLYLYSTSNMF